MAEPSGSNFIRTIVDEDLESGKHTTVVTRFPPEPNGYLHIGHAKSICLNFGLASDYNGRCHLRFDDTNPETEDMEYVRSLQHDIRWLGFDWGEHLYYASDYFEKLYLLAEQLISDGLAYIDESPDETIREMRGSVTEPGTPAAGRNRTPDENLDLFRRMRAGEFPDGAMVLRAKIDLSHSNMKMRDPLLYRIRHAAHYRAGDAWCIYPFYDYTHCLSDSFEGITHSLCTLEFENNRELYDWVIHKTRVPVRPIQTEFARLKLSNTVLSKRRMLKLVKGGHVSGWDNPRMPTIAGMRRRGYTPEAIVDFCERIGVAKADSLVDMELLEFSVRNDLNERAPRVMAVLDPLKVVVTNYEAGKTETFEVDSFPPDVGKPGSREVPFSGEIFIERSDFMEEPPRGFFRLSPGGEVRLRGAYFITCNEVIKDTDGRVIELRCTYNPASTGGASPDGRKVKGTLHWVSAAHAVSIEVRQYDRLFQVETPGGEDFLDDLNMDSIAILDGALIEPSAAQSVAGSHFQFERQGYFVVDPDSTSDKLVFNRTVSLKDSWGKTSNKPAETRATKHERTEKGTRPKEREIEPAVRATADRLKKLYEISEDRALTLAGDADIAEFFEQALVAHNSPTSVAKWVINVLSAELKDKQMAGLPFEAGQFGRLVALVDSGEISGQIGKLVFAQMLETGGEPVDIVEAEGLKTISDAGSVEPLVDEVLASFPDRVEAYKGGRQGLFGFFVGQVMQKTQGKADPKLVQELLRAKLG